MFRTAITILFTLFFITGTAAGETWTFGVWNIENLSPTKKRGFPELMGDKALPPRTDNQLEQIASYIEEDLGADALMLSEIYVSETTDGLPRNSQLDKIAAAMGSEWKYNMSATGAKCLAFLYNSERVKVEKIMEFPCEKFTSSHKDIFDRDPLVAWITVLVDGQEIDDLLLIGLHLKSGKEYRDNHLMAMIKLVSELHKFRGRDGFLKQNGFAEDGNDIIILGDLNDDSHNRRNFKYIFEYMDEKGYSHLCANDGDHPGTRINGSEIDHVFVKDHLVDDGWIDINSFVVHDDIEDTVNFREVFSDHFPLTFEFNFWTEE